MNYEKSQDILKKVKSAQKIYMACHSSPDPDSIASSLAFQLALSQININSEVVCPDEVPGQLGFLTNALNIKKFDAQTFKLNEGELLAVLDISSWNTLYGEVKPVSKENFFRIDHHRGGTIESELEIVDLEKSSTSELLYFLFEDWGIEITPEIATCLLTGIVGDTGSFQYELTKPSTHLVAAKLFEHGADRDTVYLNLYRSTKFDTYKLIGKFLTNMVFEEENFVWTAVSFDEYSECGKPERSQFMDSILSSVVGANFGVRLAEKEAGCISLSFRSRHPDRVNISTLAKKFGGGGHIAAAGAYLEGDFKEVVEKVVSEAKLFASQL